MLILMAVSAAGNRGSGTGGLALFCVKFGACDANSRSRHRQVVKRFLSLMRVISQAVDQARCQAPSAVPRAKAQEGEPVHCSGGLASFNVHINYPHVLVAEATHGYVSVPRPGGINHARELTPG